MGSSVFFKQCFINKVCSRSHGLAEVVLKQILSSGAFSREARAGSLKQFALRFARLISILVTHVFLLGFVELRLMTYACACIYSRIVSHAAQDEYVSHANYLSFEFHDTILPLEYLAPESHDKYLSRVEPWNAVTLERELT